MKNKKLLLSLTFILVLTFFLSSINASLDCLKTEKLETNYTFCQTCYDANYITLSSIQTPNYLLSLNENMTSKGSGDFCYNLILNQTGRWDFRGISDGCLNTYATCLYVTPNGDDFTTSKSFLFIGLLFLLVLFLVGGIYGLANAINGAWQITYICLAYLSLFAIFFVSWLYSSNYLWETPILASIFWILWLIMAFGFFPFILVIGVYIIGKGIQENLFKQYRAEGYTDEEARDMAKKQRR